MNGFMYCSTGTWRFNSIQSGPGGKVRFRLSSLILILTSHDQCHVEYSRKIGGRLVVESLSLTLSKVKKTIGTKREIKLLFNPVVTVTMARCSSADGCG